MSVRKNKWRNRFWFTFKVVTRVVVSVVLLIALALSMAISYLSRPDVLAELVRNEISRRMNAPVQIGSIAYAIDGSIVIDDVVINLDPEDSFLKASTKSKNLSAASTTQPGTQPASQPASENSISSQSDVKSDSQAAKAPAEPTISAADDALSKKFELIGSDISQTEEEAAFQERASRFLRVKRIVVRQNLTALLAWQPFIKSISISRPTLFVIEDAQTGQYNLKSLKFITRTDDQLDEESSKALSAIAPSLPPVTIEGARVFTAILDKGTFKPVGVLRLRAELNPDRSNPGNYRFFVQQFKNTGRDQDIQIDGYLNPDQQIVAGQIKGFDLKAPIADYLPESYRLYWDQFQPAGQINLLTFSYSPKSGVGVSLGLINGAVTLDALTGAYDSTHRRLVDVDLKVNLFKDKINVEHFRGKLGMLTYEAQGNLSGMAATAPFELKVAINPFVIPDKPADLESLPAIVQKYYQRLKPAGTFSTNITARRTTTGAPIQYNGTVQISNGKITYADFAYPVHNVYGQVHFSNEEARIDKMSATGPTGAKLTINGYFRPPGDGAEVLLNITGKDIPLDQHVRAAFGPQTLKIYNMVRDPDLYKKLIENKVITNDPKDKTLPYFTLDSKASMVTTVSRKIGLDSKYLTTVNIDAKGAKVLFQYWPYPLEITGGAIVVSPPNVLLDGITFKCPSGAEGVITGTIGGGDSPEAPLNPNLKLSVKKLPVNPLFLSALPPDYSEFIESLALTGMIQVDGRVFQDPVDHGIDFRLDTIVTNGSARPNGAGYSLDKFEGEAVVSRNGVEFKELRAWHGETRLSMLGEARIIDKRQQSRIYVEFFDLQLTDPFCDLIPKEIKARDEIQKTLRTFAVAGKVNGRLYVQNIRADEPPLSGRVEPQTLAFNYAGDRIEFSKVTGGIDFDLDSMDFDRLGIEIGFTTAEIRGTASAKNVGEFDIQFDAKGPNLVAPTSYLIPKGLRSAIDNIDVKTGFEIINANFKGTRDNDGRLAVAVSGMADLRNTSLKLGTPITIPRSRVNASIRHSSDMKMAQSDVHLFAPTVQMLGRNLDDLTLLTSTTGRDGVVNIKNLNAGLYDGKISTTGKFDTAGLQPFDLTMVIDNSRLDMVMNPNKEQPQIKPAQNNTVKDIFKTSGQIIGDVFSLGNLALSQADKLTNNADSKVLAQAGFGATQPGDEDLPIAPTPRGSSTDARVSAAMKVQGDTTSVNTYKGKGTIAASGLDGKAMPTAMAVFHLINLRFPDAQAFNQMNAAFNIDGRMIWFNNILVVSPSMELTGTGAVNWKTQAIDFKFITQAPAALNLGPITALIDAIKNQIISIRVDGSFAKPSAYLQPLGGNHQVTSENTSVDDD